jgi:hypothetical protein
MMTIHLPENLEHDIKATVLSGRFASEDEAITEAVRLLLRQLNPDQPEAEGPASDPMKSAPPPKPLWETILEITSEVPDEEWDRLPVDSSAQLDHYVYGTPRRPDP